MGFKHFPIFDRMTSYNLLYNVKRIVVKCFLELLLVVFYCALLGKELLLTFITFVFSKKVISGSIVSIV